MRPAPAAGGHTDRRRADGWVADDRKPPGAAISGAGHGTSGVTQPLGIAAGAALGSVP